jgi:hypothetical protein
MGIRESRVGFNGASEMVCGIMHISPSRSTQTKNEKCLCLGAGQWSVRSFLNSMCPDVGIHGDRKILGPHSPVVDRVIHLSCQSGPGCGLGSHQGYRKFLQIPLELSHHCLPLAVYFLPV